MKYGNTNLTQRSGYPQRQERSTFLDLPTGEETAAAASYASPPGKKHPEPRRRGQRDEPWLVRQIEAASKASFYTKASYMWTIFSLMVAYGGFRSIRSGHASVWLTCHSSSCDLEVTPPGRSKTKSIHILREQLISSDVVKVDSDGNVMDVIDSVGSTAGMASRQGHGAKPKKGRYKGNKDLFAGPDENGWYDSYIITMRANGPDESEDVNIKGDERDDKGEKEQRSKEGSEPLSRKNSLLALTEFASRSTRFSPKTNGEYVFHMRRFNIGQSRRNALSTVTRINSYIKKRRHKLTVRETRNVAWQGIVGIVLGLFSFILSLLVGQFWEPERTHKMSGPGVRNPSNARRAPPAAAGLYGRPGGTKKRATSGYGSYGGYRPSAPQKRAY